MPPRIASTVLKLPTVDTKSVTSLSVNGVTWVLSDTALVTSMRDGVVGSTVAVNPEGPEV